MTKKIIGKLIHKNPLDWKSSDWLLVIPVLILVLSVINKLFSLVHWGSIGFSNLISYSPWLSYTVLPGSVMYLWYSWEMYKKNGNGLLFVATGVISVIYSSIFTGGIILTYLG